MIKNFVIYDTETTGTDFNKNEIIKISCIKVINDTEEELLLYFLPNKPLTSEVEKLTGITNTFLNNKGDNLNNIKKLILFLNDLPIICYAAAFEKKFLEKLITSYTDANIKFSWVDLVEINRFKNKNLRFNLDELAFKAGYEFNINKKDPLAYCRKILMTYIYLSKLKSS